MVTSTAEQWATFITVNGSHLFLIRLTRPPPLPAARARPVALRLPVHIYPLLFQALLFPSSLQRPHRKTAAWSSPTPHPPFPDLPFILQNWDPLSVTSPPSVLLNLGWCLRAQASTLFWDRLKEAWLSFCSQCKSCGCWARIPWWLQAQKKPRVRPTSYQTQL